jgi:hypothetical protein
MSAAVSAVVLGLALAAPAPVTAPIPLAVPGKAATAAPTMAACTRYRVLAEKNDLAAEAEVAGWAAAALEKAGLSDPASPCSVYVRVTAGPIRSGGRQDGYVAHVAASTRRYLRDGKLVTNEKGLLLVEATKEALVAKARTFVEQYAAGLKEHREELKRGPAGDAG